MSRALSLSLSPCPVQQSAAAARAAAPLALAGPAAVAVPLAAAASLATQAPIVSVRGHSEMESISVSAVHFDPRCCALLAGPSSRGGRPLKESRAPRTAAAALCRSLWPRRGALRRFWCLQVLENFVCFSVRKRPQRARFVSSQQRQSWRGHGHCHKRASHNRHPHGRGGHSRRASRQRAASFRPIGSRATLGLHSSSSSSSSSGGGGVGGDIGDGELTQTSRARGAPAHAKRR